MDYSAKAAASLANIYDNNSLGDCVIASSYQALGTWTGNANGAPFLATDAQIIADYSAIGGYVPGNPATDQGCDIQTALNYYASKGFADGSKLLGSLAVDPTNQQECEQAVFLFEDTSIRMDLPAPWVASMPTGNGFVWDIAGPPVPANGHCIQAYGYSASGLLVDTWGLLGTLTWAAVAMYCASSAGGDLYVGINPDQVASGQSIAPNGVAWADLLADFNSMGGAVNPAGERGGRSDDPRARAASRCRGHQPGHRHHDAHAGDPARGPRPRRCVGHASRNAPWGKSQLRRRRARRSSSFGRLRRAGPARAGHAAHARHGVHPREPVGNETGEGASMVCWNIGNANGPAAPTASSPRSST